MAERTYCSIDPGLDTGISIYSSSRRLLQTGVIRYTTFAEYKERLLMMRNRWMIDVALIEAYWLMGKQFRNASKVEVQVAACKEAFPAHILVHTSQWNPQSMSERMKKAMAESVFECKFQNGHVVDSALMGKWLYDILENTAASPWELMLELGRTTRRFPLRSQLRNMRIQRFTAEKVAL